MYTIGEIHILIKSRMIEVIENLKIAKKEFDICHDITNAKNITGERIEYSNDNLKKCEQEAIKWYNIYNCHLTLGERMRRDLYDIFNKISNDSFDDFYKDLKNIIRHSQGD